jgi:hypothetical protein
MLKSFLLIVVFSITCISFSQSKKNSFKLDNSKHIKFVYIKDSSCLDLTETKKMVSVFYNFYQAIASDNYSDYLAYLSPETLKNIRKDKLERKFKKFKSYNVNLKGKTVIKSVFEFMPESNLENDKMFVCILKLKKGQTIQKRVGFDPLKRSEIENKENYVALHLVLTDTGYKVAILW